MQRLNKFLLSLFTLFCLIFSGCTWVEPVENAASVSLRNSTDISGCERLGTATSSVKDRLGWFERDEEQVASELLTLAQNSAVSMGGDTLVATADPEDGYQEFGVYSCPDN